MKAPTNKELWSQVIQRLLAKQGRKQLPTKEDQNFWGTVEKIYAKLGGEFEGGGEGEEQGLDPEHMIKPEMPQEEAPAMPQTDAPEEAPVPPAPVMDEPVEEVQPDPELEEPMEPEIEEPVEEGQPPETVEPPVQQEHPLDEEEEEEFPLEEDEEEKKMSSLVRSAMMEMWAQEDSEQPETVDLGDDEVPEQEVHDLGEGTGGASEKTVTMDDSGVHVECDEGNVTVTEDAVKIKSNSLVNKERAAYFIADQIYRELGPERRMAARIAASYDVRPMVKDLTDHIINKKNAGDLKDDELVKMAVGDWNFIYKDIVMAHGTGKTGASSLDLTKEQVQRFLAQRLYEAGVRGKDRVNTIARSAMNRIFKEGGHYRVTT